MNAMAIFTLFALVALFGLVTALCYITIRSDLLGPDDVGRGPWGAEEGTVGGGPCGEEPRPTRQSTAVSRTRKKKKHPQGESQ